MWRTDSTAGAHIWDSQPMSTSDLACRDEELAWLMRQQGKSWKLINGRIAQSGHPTALEGTYTGSLAYPPAQNLTAVTGGVANVAWWSAALYTPIPANSTLAPDAYRVIASGTITTAAASTLIPSANLGTAVGTGLSGTAATSTLGTTITGALWYWFGDVTIRTAGTAGTAIGSFVLKFGITAGNVNTISSNLCGGVAQTAIDFTAAQGVTLGGTPSVSTVSVTPMQVHWISLN